MTRTITALFDTRADADAAKARLVEARIDVDHVNIHDKTSPGYSETAHSTHQDRGIWASIKNAFLPDEDRHTYEEGVRRGGVLLTADVDEDAVAEAVRVLEDAATVDIDERAQSWRSSGWDHPTGTATDTDSATVTLPYARRDLDRGGSRARSYVNEDPTKTQA